MSTWQRDKWEQGKVEELRRLEPLRQCSATELRRLIQLSDESAVPPGFALVQQGMRTQWAYLVLDGTALALHDGLVAATIGAGEFIGRAETTSRTPAECTVVAEWGLRVLVFGRRELLWLAERRPLVTSSRSS